MSGRYRTVASYDAYDDPRYPYRRPGNTYPNRVVYVRPAPTKVRHSHAAVPVAAFLLLVGLILGHYTVLIPALLGLVMLYTALSFLSTRLNPFSVGFYLTVKPSWTAIGVLVLLGFVLLFVAYSYYRSGYGPVLPAIAKFPYRLP